MIFQTHKNKVTSDHLTLLAHKGPQKPRYWEKLQCWVSSHLEGGMQGTSQLWQQILHIRLTGPSSSGILKQETFMGTLTLIRNLIVRWQLIWTLSVLVAILKSVSTKRTDEVSAMPSLFSLFWIDTGKLWLSFHFIVLPSPFAFCSTKMQCQHSVA